MSQLEVAYAERVTSAGGGSSATFAPTADPNIPAASFVTGKKYWLVIRSELRMNVVGTRGGFRALHGSTVFDGSTIEFTTAAGANGSVGEREIYNYMTVWTAVAGEGINLEFHGDGTNTCEHRFTSILAMRLTDFLTENVDWFYNESLPDITLTTTNQNGASLTFTPGVAAQKWMVNSFARLTVDAANDQFVSRLDRTGEAVASWDALRPGRVATAGADSHAYPHLWVGTLGAVSQTFKEQARRVGTAAAAAQRTHSAIFALNVSKLDVASSMLSDAHVDITANLAWNNLVATLPHTQLVDGGNVLVLGSFMFDPNETGGNQRNYSARVQLDNVDIFSADGVTNTYTGQTPFPRHVYPVQASSSVGETWPYFHMSVEALAAGAHDIDIDVGINSGSGVAGPGTKFHRILALSLEVTPPAPPAGAGGSPAVERNEQIMYLHDYKPERRRVVVRLVDATDNVTPEAAEAGGQPSMSKNGAAFTNTGVGVLVAVDAPNGLYYTEITQAALDALGSLRIRYKSAATALFTTTVAVEELPWLYDGLASAGGANYADLSSPPTYVQAGTIAKIVDGPGAGQSMLVQSYASPRITMEANWDTQPTAASQILLLPGLAFIVPDVNVAQIDRNPTAAVNLREGAEAILVSLVRAGANSTTQVVCDLPTLVNAVAVPPNFYKDRTIIFKTGSLARDEALITSSVTSGADTILTVDTLTSVPVVGNKFVVT